MEIFRKHLLEINTFGQEEMTKVKIGIKQPA